MTTYIVWFKIGNYRTTESHLQASDFGAAQLIAESMYGKENVISIRSA
jgi:hypothetical protein